MATREKIRVGIDRIINHWDGSHSISADWQPLYSGATVGQDIVLYLHSQGLGMKVKRGLPFDCVNCYHHHCHPSTNPKPCTCELNKAISTCTEGIPEYCPLKAVEPLIEVKDGANLEIKEGIMEQSKSIIIENVRGKWIIDEASTGVFQDEGKGYGDGALFEIEIASYKSLCCHPNTPTVCPHGKDI